MSLSVFVPRLTDANNTNPQIANAKALLLRWPDDSVRVTALHYGTPDPKLREKNEIFLVKLWRWRFWRASMFLAYQGRYDAIFYPGADIADDLGWRFRDWTGRRVPIIATLEGLVGNLEREQQYSEWAGHSVYCQRVPSEVIARCDRVVGRADRIIALSPFLARIGRQAYGEKFEVLPLGIERNIFNDQGRAPKDSFSVVGCGRLYDNKRPDLFLQLALRFPSVEFTWYGDGEMRSPLLHEKQRLGLKNVHFPGSVSPFHLADAFRRAHLFVLPSLSEGAPKVLQEASACGLPVICFGFYETPHVVDGENGFVVWDDEQLFFRVEQLLNDPALAERLGKRGAEMARSWDWDIVAPQWLAAVSGVLNG